MSNLKLVLIDDHPLFRLGIKSIINKNENLTILEEASNGKDGLKIIKNKKPDIAILDISLPDISGIDLLEKIKEDNLKVIVIMLSMHSKFKYIARAIQLGAKGYLVKESAADNLMEAIETVVKGEFYIDRSISAKVINKLYERSVNPDVDNPYKNLTDREQEVMRLMVEGLSYKKIAEKLFISQRTVEQHRSNIMGKLNLKNNIQLFKYAAKIGLVDIEQEE